MSGNHMFYIYTSRWCGKCENAKNRLHCIEREICCRLSLRHSTASVHIPVNMFRNVSVNAVVTPSAASTPLVGVTPYSLYENVFVTYLNKITFLYCAQNIISSASPWLPFPQCRKKQVCIRRHQDFLLTLLQGVCNVTLWNGTYRSKPPSNFSPHQPCARCFLLNPQDIPASRCTSVRLGPPSASWLNWPSCSLLWRTDPSSEDRRVSSDLWGYFLCRSVVEILGRNSSRDWIPGGSVTMDWTRTLWSLASRNACWIATRSPASTWNTGVSYRAM